MKASYSAVIAAIAMFGMTPASADIIYTLTPLTVGFLTETGTITTDGHTGVLSTADITAFNITISGGPAVPAITQISGAAEILGDAVTATLTTLSFNFGDVNPSHLQFTQGETGAALQNGGLEELVATNSFFTEGIGSGDPVIASVLAAPGPIYGAGLPGIIFALGGLFLWFHRSQQRRPNYFAAGSMTLA
jgi:hypothetical protein